MLGPLAPAMGSTLGRLAWSSARGLSTSTAASDAATAVSKADSPSAGGGATNLASMLGFGSTRIDTPLSEPLPWVPPPPRGTRLKTPPKLESGSLSSGMPAVAVDTGSPVSTVAIAFGAGSSSETHHTLGASRVLANMAFRATTNRTTFRLTRELEKIGATPAAYAGRDHISMGISTLKMHTPEAIEMLLDATMNARLNYHEFAESMIMVQAQLRASAKDPMAMITDALHRAAYEGNLGLPTQLDPADISHLNFSALREYYANVVKSSRTVLAAAGMGLQEVSNLATPLLPACTDTKALAAPQAAESKYVGGSLNVIAPSPLTYVALALEAKGGLSDPKSEAAAAVVRVLLDAARAVLPRTRRESDVLVSAGSFAHMYTNTGLVGMVGATAPAQTSQLVNDVMQRMEAIAKGVPEQQVQQAKQLAIGQYKQATGSTYGMVKSMAPHLLLAGKFEPTDFPSKVESLTPSDISNFVADALKRTPTMVSYGSMASAPRLGQAMASKRLA